tara:strand:+ start:274 stop:480 length:207 start_codon:yes stop_codon:yes gene_type:complete
MNWRKTETEIQIGFDITSLISFKLIVSPIPNITIPNKNGIKDFIELNMSGLKKLSDKKNKIKKGKLNL